MTAAVVELMVILGVIAIVGAFSAWGLSRAQVNQRRYAEATIQHPRLMNPVDLVSGQSEMNKPKSTTMAQAAGASRQREEAMAQAAGASKPQQEETSDLNAIKTGKGENAAFSGHSG